jgi:putative ABC transport system permease protein
MVLLRLAYKNILRKKRRSLLTIIGFAASISLLFAVFSITSGFEKRIDRELHRVAINFMVVPVGCPHEIASLLFYGKVSPVFLDESIVDNIADPRIEMASPMTVIEIPTPKKKEKLLMYGYELWRLKEIKPKWKVRGEIPIGWEAEEMNKIIVGSDFAEKNGLKIGDSITLPYTEMSFLVSGILEKTYSKDDAFIYAPLYLAQEVAIKVTGREVIKIPDYSCHGLSEDITERPISAVAVKLKDPALFEQVSEELKKKMPGIQIVSVEQAMKSVSDIAASAKALALFIVAFAFLISAAGIINSMLMTVFEQTREIGMMRAIGASRSDIFKIIIFEAVITTSVGTIAGILLTMSGASIIEGIIGRFIPFTYGKGFIIFDITLASICLLLSLVLGILAGLYPAWRASRVVPVKAIKSL